METENLSARGGRPIRNENMDRSAIGWRAMVDTLAALIAVIASQ
jgi:hypothetical protein